MRLKWPAVYGWDMNNCGYYKVDDDGETWKLVADAFYDRVPSPEIPLNPS